MKTTRREFLARTSLAGVVSIGATAPSFLNRAAWAGTDLKSANQKAERILVLIELAGGNDGLNTVVPFADDHYHKARPGIRLSGDAILKLDDTHGLHPQMTGMKSIYDEGRLAIVQGVGYPNPDRSHFRSMDIWHSARPDDTDFRGDGWLGRALDHSSEHYLGKVPALAVGTERLPRALLGNNVNVPMLRDLNAFKWESSQGSKAAQQRRREVIEALASRSAASGSTLDFLRRTTTTASQTAKRLENISSSYQAAATYPNNSLGRKLETVAQLIAADLGTRIFFVSLGGFDTHSQQEGSHAALIGELSTAIEAFYRDIKGHQLRDRVLLATFSEFGRRVEENGSVGTDHGTASQMFVVTPEDTSRTGLIGAHPSLSDLDENGDMKFHTDFRSVYATLLENWLGLPSENALGGTFDRLDFV